MSKVCCLLLCCLLSTLAISSYAAQTKLEIPGTGDSQELLRRLARDYQERHPGTMVEIPESDGTVGGLRRVLDGKSTLSRVARPLTSHERERGLNSWVFAWSPVVFAANLPEPCLEGLSASEVVGIWSGRITSWDRLGNCTDHKIYVANREPGDSSRRILSGVIPGFSEIGHYEGETLYNTPEMVRILERHPFSIGYVPLAMVISSPLRRLSYEGVEPTAENIRKQRYPLAVPLGLAWVEPLTPAAEAFLQYLQTPAAHALIRDAGAVPAEAP